MFNWKRSSGFQNILLLLCVETITRYSQWLLQDVDFAQCILESEIGFSC